MRILILSDTHTYMPKGLPDADVLVHCGDATYSGYLSEIRAFNAWLGSIRSKYKHILFVPGNHDTSFERNSGEALEAVTNAEVLIDREFIVDGVKFYGSPWTVPFGSWAFMRNCEARKRYFDMIPQDTDVLITHGPPQFVLDKTFITEDNAGCDILAKKVLEVKPKVHCFGHIHEGFGMLDKDGVAYINASLLDVYYKPTNHPVLIELQDGKVEVL